MIINGIHIDLDFFNGTGDSDFEALRFFRFLFEFDSILYFSCSTHLFPPLSGTNFSLVVLLISNMMYVEYGILLDVIVFHLLEHHVYYVKRLPEQNMIQWDPAWSVNLTFISNQGIDSLSNNPV